MKNKTIPDKETLLRIKEEALAVYIQKKDQYRDDGDKEKESKVAIKIAKIKEEIIALKEDKAAPAPVKPGSASQFLTSGKNINNHFRKKDETYEKVRTISLEGVRDTLSNVSQGKSATQPIAGALSRFLGLFAGRKNTSAENKQEVNVSAKQDRGFGQR